MEFGGISCAMSHSGKLMSGVGRGAQKTSMQRNALDHLVEST